YTISQIHIDGIPEYGAKSRVETQIKLCLSLVNHTGCRIPHWPYIRIPACLLSRTNRRNQHNASSDGSTTAMVSDESKVLNLEARVICASDETKDIKTCAGCAKRERKRAERKKNKLLATEEEFERLLLLNCESLVAFDTASTTLFIRITCYCRHHNERIGYRVRFILKNHHGQAIATGETPIILITDDHKAIKESMAQRNKATEHYLTPLPTPKQEQDDIWCMKTALLDDPFHLPNDTFRTLCVPTVVSVVPDKGPLMGGREITLFGHDFSPDLILMFGHRPAVILQCHLTHLVCILPPADRAGRCLISFQDTPLIRACPVPPTFDYHDTSYHDISHLTYRMLSSPFLYGSLVESDIICLLSQHEGISLTETTSNGQTLLHLACHLGYLELALYLIHKAPMLVNCLDRNGLSALYFAPNSLYTILLESQWFHQTGV
ncbi:hypothetical protein EDC96DRAFT_451540, partial [Choanephora cucurbitarum]